MRATTETDRRVVVISWVVAGLAAVGGMLGIWLLPTPDNSALSAPGRAEVTRQPRKDERKKKRPLPKEYREKMIDSSETLVKRELRQRLRRFEAMAEKVYRKEDALLDQIANRPVPAEARAGINETTIARGKAPADDAPLGTNPSVRVLYERLAGLEARIQEDHMTTKAAEKALQEGLSFPDTLRGMPPGTTRMPGYRNLVISFNEQHQLDGDTMNPRSIEDINRYRDLLGQTTRQDTGMSWYHLEKHIEAFPFQAGWNRVLIRLENNGGAATGFSFLICPQDVALAEAKKPTS